MEWMKLTDVCDINDKSVQEFEGLKEYVATGDIDFNNIIASETITYNNKPSRANREVNNGDVIFAKMKGTIKVFKITEEVSDKYIFSTGFTTLNAKLNKLTQDYLYYILISDIFQNQKDKYSSGATQKAINNTNLKKIKIPVPPLAIQEQIVEVLDRAQELIDKRKAQLEAMDSLIESIFYTMFGDPVRNEKGWEVKKLGEYIKILTDYHANGSYKILKDHVELLDKKSYALMIRTTDLESKNFKEDVKYISKEAYDFLDKSKVYPNDIIINKIGSAGQVYIMPDLNCKVSLGMNQFLLRMNSELKHIYIYYLFNVKSGEMLIKSKAKGAVTKTINKNSIRSITIPIPPLDLQNEFAQKVGLIEREKEVFEESLELMEENYRSIMDRAFKGELFK